MSIPQNAERDERIETLYIGGMTIGDIAQVVGITKSRIQQILKRRGIRRENRVPEEMRGSFLGVHLSDDMKAALRTEAEKRGVSMSLLSSETLRGMLESCGYPVTLEN